ncbi:MAG: helix-turn-helix transcriptional regulator [Chromatiales bacterium]|nr:helix-turn-helix transcriptional regulator [Chromatiales bacterium]
MITAGRTAGGQALARLVAEASAAPLRPDGWQHFLETATRQFHSNMGALILRDPQDPEGALLHLSGPGQGFERAFRALQGDEEDYWTQAMTAGPTGTVRIGTEIIARDAMRNTRLYRKLAAPWAIEHFLGGVILNSPNLNAYLSLTRPDGEPPFSAEDKRLMADWLLPCLRRSLQLHRELDRLRALNSALLTALDQAPYGAVFLDRTGRLLHANRRAQRMLRAGNQLRVVAGRLQSADSGLRGALREAIEQALHAARSRSHPRHRPATIQAGRFGEKAACRVVIFPLGPPRQRAGALPVGAACMVLLHTDGQRGSLSIPSLVERYQLSPGEARVVGELFSGKSLTESAGALGISRNTAKSHLSRVFDKTGVRSQAALLKLLALDSLAPGEPERIRSLQ